MTMVMLSLMMVAVLIAISKSRITATTNLLPQDARDLGIDKQISQSTRKATKTPMVTLRV